MNRQDLPHANKGLLKCFVHSFVVGYAIIVRQPRLVICPTSAAV